MCESSGKQVAQVGKKTPSLHWKASTGPTGLILVSWRHRFETNPHCEISRCSLSLS